MTQTQTEEQDPGANRLEERLDAVLHLLDRQVADCDGRLVGKVDDVELSEKGDGTLHATGILTGAAALVPRLGGNHDREFLAWWQRLSPARADRDVPGWISLDDVEALGSALTLSRPREGLVVPQPAAEEGVTHRRLAGLLGMRLDGPGDSTQVVDVRLEPEVDGSPRVTSLLVGKVRPGLLLGYDRARVDGPWLLARVLGWVNRFTRELAWADVAGVDWEERTVHADEEPGPVQPLHPE